MKSKRTVLILILVFVLLLGGAYVLYDKLSGDAAPILSVNTGADTPAPTTSVTPEAPDSTSVPPETPAAQESTVPEKVMAPDFSVQDAEGNMVSLSDFQGKPVVLNFWASWCGPCKSEMPDFDEAYGELGDDIHFLMVNLTDGSRETLEAAQDYISQQGYTFPTYYDTELSAAIAYGVMSIPTTYFIDAEGYAIAQAMGAINSETLQTGIDMILPQA